MIVAECYAFVIKTDSRIVGIVLPLQLHTKYYKAAIKNLLHIILEGVS